MSKGRTNNPAGRPPGTPNKAGAELRERVMAFVADRWEQVESDYTQLEPKERLQFLEKLMAYSLPKLQAVAVDIHGAATSVVWNETKNYEGANPVTIFRIPDNGRSFDPRTMTDEELNAIIAEGDEDEDED